MQFMIEVLPAPCGPMIENNSPSFTPKLPSVSARTPPKRSDTPRTSKACSTRSLRKGAFRAYLAIGEINPVHRDGSTCFTPIGTSTAAPAAGSWLPQGPADFDIRLHRGRMLLPAPLAEGLLRAIWPGKQGRDRSFGLPGRHCRQAG